jgi:NTP pyrophosphatase (non-canonical NTP hydrolase)
MDDQRTPLSGLQASVDAWASRYWGGEYWPPLANLARLTEEVGELARMVNQIHGPKRIKPDEAAGRLAEEMGDVLFVLLCIANSTGIDMQQAFDETLKKYAVRDEREPETTQR